MGGEFASKEMRPAPLLCVGLRRTVGARAPSTLMGEKPNKGYTAFASED